jgi:hypothetical protein
VIHSCYHVIQKLQFNPNFDTNFFSPSSPFQVKCTIASHTICWNAAYTENDLFQISKFHIFYVSCQALKRKIWALKYASGLARIQTKDPSTVTTDFKTLNICAKDFWLPCSFQWFAFPTQFSAITLLVTRFFSDSSAYFTSKPSVMPLSIECIVFHENKCLVHPSKRGFNVVCELWHANSFIKMTVIVRRTKT